MFGCPKDGNGVSFMVNGAAAGFGTFINGLSMEGFTVDDGRVMEAA